MLWTYSTQSNPNMFTYLVPILNKIQNQFGDIYEWTTHTYISKYNTSINKYITYLHRQNNLKFT